MGQEHFLEATDWPLRSRRRELRIGDLMVAVAMTAIGLSAVSLADPNIDDRTFLGLATLAFVGLQWAQWGLASFPSRRSWPGTPIILGIVSSLLALSSFTLLIVLGLFFPQGAALLSVLILIQAVYLTTWD